MLLLLLLFAIACTFVVNSDCQWKRKSFWHLTNATTTTRRALTIQKKTTLDYLQKSETNAGVVFKSESEWVEWGEKNRLTLSRLGVDFSMESTQMGNFWQLLELICLIVALIIHFDCDFSILVNYKLDWVGLVIISSFFGQFKQIYYLLIKNWHLKVMAI